METFQEKANKYINRMIESSHVAIRKVSEGIFVVEKSRYGLIGAYLTYQDVVNYLNDKEKVLILNESNSNVITKNF
jgi:hypothetical protein